MNLRSGLTNDGVSNPSTNALFLSLAVTKAAHSIEEFYFRLFDVFAPARYVSRLISDDLALGFAVINTLIVVFVFWTYFRRVRPAAGCTTAWMWGWSLLEFGNGNGHFIFAADADAYFPGLFTAPFLVLFSLALMYRLVHPVGRTPVPRRGGESQCTKK